MATLTSKADARIWLEDVFDGTIYNMAMADFHNQRENCQLEGKDRIDFLRKIADSKVKKFATPTLIEIWELSRPDLVKFIIAAQQEFQEVRITTTARIFLVAGLQMHVWIDKHYKDELKLQKFPDITNQHRKFLDHCTTEQKDRILHAIYKHCKNWTVGYGMAKNWKILYNVLEVLHVFEYVKRKRYKDFVESVVFYVIKDVDVSKVSNSLSTVKDMDNRNSYSDDDGKIYDDLLDDIKTAKISSN